MGMGYMGWFKSSLLQVTISTVALALFCGCGGSLEGTNTNSGVTVRGKVFNIDGSGVPGVQIEATEDNLTFTAADGSYLLDNVPATTRELFFTISGIQSVVPLEIPFGIETLEVNFELQSDGTVIQSESKAQGDVEPAISLADDNTSATPSSGEDSNDNAKPKDPKPDVQATPSPTPPIDILGLTLPDMTLNQLSSGEEASALRISNGGISTYTTTGESLYQLSNGVETLIDLNVQAFEPSSDGSIVVYLTGDKEGTSFELKLYKSKEQLSQSLGITLTAIPKQVVINQDSTKFALLSKEDKIGVNSIAIYDLQTGKELYTYSGAFISGLIFSPKGELVAFQSISEKDGHSISIVQISTGESKVIRLEGSSEAATLAAVTDQGALYFISSLVNADNPAGNIQIYGAIPNEKEYEVVKLTRNSKNVTISSPQLCDDRLTFATKSNLIDTQNIEGNTQYMELRFKNGRQIVSPITQFKKGYNLPIDGIVRSPDCKLVSWIESKKDPKTPRAALGGFQGIMVLRLLFKSSKTGVEPTVVKPTTAETATSSEAELLS